MVLSGTLRSKTITGLKSNQNYQWHIRAKCGKTWTAYSNAIAFKTLGSSAPITQIGSKGMQKVVPEMVGIQVSVLPNPSTSSFTLTIQSSSQKAVTLRMVDAVGRMVEGKAGVASNSTLRVGQNYRPGVYYAQVLQDGKMVVVKLIKQ
jgi:hypothetical protein